MVPVVNSIEELKQFLSSSGANNISSDGNAVANSYNESGAFISATSDSTNTYDLNNLQVGGSSGVIDANQYYQQGATTTDYNNYGVTNATSYPISGENVGYYQQGDTTTTNYYQGAEGTTNVDYTLNSQPTGTFDLNNLNMGNTYEVNGASASTMTFSGDQGITNYNTYGATQDITTSNVQSTYVTPTQNYSYNYSYSNPIASSQY